MPRLSPPCGQARIVGELLRRRLVLAGPPPGSAKGMGYVDHHERVDPGEVTRVPRVDRAPDQPTRWWTRRCSSMWWPSASSKGPWVRACVDRKRVVSGKSVPVRVDLGSRRMIKIK